MPARLRSLALCLLFFGLVLSGCSKDKGKPPTPTPRPASVPPPTFTVEQVRSALLEKEDFPKGWRTIPADDQRPSLQESKYEFCGQSKAKVPGDPEILKQQFAGKDNRISGASWAQLVLVYPTPQDATEAFEAMRERAADCPAKKIHPRRTLEAHRAIEQHSDTWKLTEDAIAGWTHARGLERADYPDWLSDYNVILTAYDYSAYGNVIISSAYWQGVKPEDSGKNFAEDAASVLTKQLERIG